MISLHGIIGEHEEPDLMVPNHVKREEHLVSTLKQIQEKNEILSNENASLRTIISTLEERLMKLETAPTKDGTYSQPGPSSEENTRQVQYFTDEEELARETEWQVKKKKRFQKENKSGISRETDWILEKNKSKQDKMDISKQIVQNNVKKRKMNSPPKMNSPKKGSEQNLTTAPPVKAKQPPPVFIEKVVDLKILIAELKRQNFEGKITSLASNSSFKINCTSEDEYRKITSWLNTSKTEWHSFSNKQTRPLKVMARGLHSASSPDDIIQDLKNKGFNVLEAVNILCNKTKKPLNLFMLSFDNKEDASKVYEIKVINYQKVKIEELRKTSTRIVQCKNCQGFNHVKTYCHKQPRCVKCAGEHESEKCTKQVNEPPKCVNCGKPHTANYRGCEVAKELQRLRNTNVQKKNQNKQQGAKPLTRTEQSTNLSQSFKIVDPSITYAQKVTNPSKNENEQALMKTHSEGLVLEVLHRMEKRLEQQDKFNQMVLKEFETMKIRLNNKLSSYQWQAR